MTDETPDRTPDAPETATAEPGVDFARKARRGAKPGRGAKSTAKHNPGPAGGHDSESAGETAPGPADGLFEARIENPNDMRFKLPIFEGPLDLLLHLIKLNEMEITEIAVSEITTQYLDTVRLMETLDLEVAGDYLVMAATLINIKLRSLLPTHEEQEEPEEEIDDFLSARELMQKLIEYRKFKEAALKLGRRAEEQSEIFYREVALPKLAEAREDPEIQGDLDMLLAAFSRVVQFVERRDYHQVDEENVTVDEQMRFVRQRLFVESRVSMSALFRECSSRIQMIVTLFALLELCRQKELHLEQTENFHDVFISRRTDKGDDPESEEARAAASELEQLEHEIIANRTGLVDDGILDDDEAGDIETTDAGDSMGSDDSDNSDDQSQPMAARIVDLSTDTPDTPGGDEEPEHR